MRLKFYTACYYLASDLAIWLKKKLEQRTRSVRQNVRVS